jgi:hypothetical protein
MGVQITGYRVDRWLNTKTNEELFGVSVSVAGRKGWIRVADDGQAVIVESIEEARDYIEKMKSERDSEGFKKGDVRCG